MLDYADYTDSHTIIAEMLADARYMLRFTLRCRLADVCYDAD